MEQQSHHRRFERAVVLVTGSTSGIGEATAKRFAREGASVVVNGRSVDAGQSVAGSIRDCGGDAVFVEADLAHPEEIERLIREAVDEYGRIDVLVNNAAVQIQKTVAETTLEDWSTAIAINFRAYWLCVREALEHMGEGSSVVNVSSNHSMLTMPGAFPYNAIKSGIDGMTRAMALELGPEIRVNAINPGWTQVREPEGDEAIESWRERAELHPLKRVGQPEDIAGSIAFLASEDAAFVTGATLLADGGRSAVMQDGSFLDDSRSG